MRPGKRKVLDKSTPMGAIQDQLERANGKWGQIKIICSRLPRIRIQPFQYFKLHSYPRKPVMRWSLFHP